ncbi:MAG: small multi-drug export protein [Clostridia bacterium]|nr:small multi-drug export protein [Clostridia bacterium]
MGLSEFIAQNGFSDGLVYWFTSLFADGTAKELIVFLTSLLPVLECRGAMVAAKLFELPFLSSFLISYIGNMIPVPFILLLIRQIFAFMKKHNILTKFIEKLEGKTEKNKDKILRYKQWGLLLFVAIPLPGTGAWTGSLFAALLHIDFKKALPIVALGVFIADAIMAAVTYGLGAIFNF